MNARTYVSGNLALSVTLQEDEKLTVINGSQIGDFSVNPSDGREFRADRSHSLLSRAAFFAFTCILVFVCAFKVSSEVSSPTYEMVEQMDLQTIRAKQGQTLWEIAETYDVEGVSTADMVSAIRDWNHLNDSLLQPGQSLLVANPS